MTPDEVHRIVSRLKYEDDIDEVVIEIIQIFQHKRTDLDALYPSSSVENIRSLINKAATIERLECRI